jgi:hypothetical protein
MGEEIYEKENNIMSPYMDSSDMASSDTFGVGIHKTMSEPEFYGQPINITQVRGGLNLTK